MTLAETPANPVCPRCDGNGLAEKSSNDCPTCEGRVTLSEIATTPQERSRVRGQTKYRRGYARTTQGQTNRTYNQARQNNGGLAPEPRYGST